MCQSTSVINALFVLFLFERSFIHYIQTVKNMYTECTIYYRTIFNRCKSPHPLPLKVEGRTPREPTIFRSPIQHKGFKHTTTKTSDLQAWKTLPHRKLLGCVKWLLWPTPSSEKTRPRRPIQTRPPPIQPRPKQVPQPAASSFRISSTPAARCALTNKRI